MKQKLTNNIGFKILSVVFATILWLVVLNVNDPEKTTTINNIPIKIVNEDAITGQDKVYEVVSGKTASVKVTGPRTIVDSLDAKSFTAIADLSKLSVTNAVDIEVELNTVSYRTKVDLDSKTTMVVSIEDLVEKEFPIEILKKGTEASGYVVYKTNVQHSTVKVKAPASVMNNIAKVVATINVSNVVDDFTVRSALKACDSAGNILDAKNLGITFDVEETSVDVVMYSVKQVPLKYEILEDKYANTVFVSKEIDRKSILLVGRKEALAGVNEIVLDTSMLEINANQSRYTLSYELEELLPAGTYLYGDGKSATITIETDAIIRKNFTISIADIAIKSPAEGYTAYIETTGNIRYILEGRKSILDKFVPDDNMFVSAKNLTEGVYEVALEMNLVEGIEQVGKVYVTVKVVPKETDTEDNTGDLPGENESDNTSTENQQPPEEETTVG